MGPSLRPGKTEGKKKEGDHRRFRNSAKLEVERHQIRNKSVSTRQHRAARKKTKEEMLGGGEQSVYYVVTGEPRVTGKCKAQGE